MSGLFIAGDVDVHLWQQAVLALDSRMRVHVDGEDVTARLCLFNMERGYAVLFVLHGEGYARAHNGLPALERRWGRVEVRTAE